MALLVPSVTYRGCASTGMLDDSFAGMLSTGIHTPGLVVFRRGSWGHLNGIASTLSLYLQERPLRRYGKGVAPPSSAITRTYVVNSSTAESERSRSRLIARTSHGALWLLWVLQA